MEYPYLKFINRVEERPTSEGCVNRWYYIGDDERFIINVTSCEHNKKDKNDLMNLWIQHGFVRTFLPTTLHVDTYFTTERGDCYGWYNITHILKEELYGDKPYKRYILDFTYLLEATEENIKFLVNGCIRMREMDIRHAEVK